MATIKYVYINFSDRTYRIDASVIAEHRARYYVLNYAKNKDKEEVYQQQLSLALSSLYVLNDWILAEMSWDDLENKATLVSTNNLLTLSERWANQDFTITLDSPASRKDDNL